MVMTMKSTVVCCFFIHFFIDSLEDTAEYQVSSFKLDRTPPQDFVHYLQCKPVTERRALCNEILPKLKIVKPLNKIIGNDDYVPKALQYVDDSGSKKIAIRCPTVPAVYIFAEPMVEGYIYKALTVRPSQIIESFDFVVEAAQEITLLEEDQLSQQTLAQTKSHFYLLEAEQLWYLCDKAIKTIKYAYQDVEWNGQPLARPNVYKMNYSFWSMYDVAVSCPTKVPIYLRAGNSAQDKVVPIILQKISVIVNQHTTTNSPNERPPRRAITK